MIKPVAVSVLVTVVGAACGWGLAYTGVGGPFLALMLLAVGPLVVGLLIERWPVIAALLFNLPLAAVPILLNWSQAQWVSQGKALIHAAVMIAVAVVLAQLAWLSAYLRRRQKAGGQL